MKNTENLVSGASLSNCNNKATMPKIMMALERYTQRLPIKSLMNLSFFVTGFGVASGLGRLTSQNAQWWMMGMIIAAIAIQFVMVTLPLVLVMLMARGVTPPNQALSQPCKDERENDA